MSEKNFRSPGLALSPHWFTFWNLFSTSVLLVKSTVFLRLTQTSLWKLHESAEIFTSPSFKPEQFGSIAHVSRFKSEWHENFNGFHRTTWGFLSHPKARITEFCDQQAVKWACIQNTSSSDVLGRPTLRSGFLS